MKYFLALLLLLVANIVVAQDLVSSDIELTAPETCVVGELVVLDASASNSETLVWDIEPETDDFKIFGKQACFSSREGGEYLIIIAGIIGGQPILKKHILTVEGSVLVSSDLTSKMKVWAKAVTSEKKTEEALKFSLEPKSQLNGSLKPQRTRTDVPLVNLSKPGNRFLIGLGFTLIHSPPKVNSKPKMNIKRPGSVWQTALRSPSNETTNVPGNDPGSASSRPSRGTRTENAILRGTQTINAAEAGSIHQGVQTVSRSQQRPERISVEVSRNTNRGTRTSYSKQGWCERGRLCWSSFRFRCRRSGGM
jgi:hypothetical protein